MISNCIFVWYFYSFHIKAQFHREALDGAQRFAPLRSISTSDVNSDIFFYKCLLKCYLYVFFCSCIKARSETFLLSG